MKNPKIWLLVAPSPARIVVPQIEEPIPLLSRSTDLVGLIKKIALDRKGVEIRASEWKAAKKSLSNILDGFVEMDSVKESLGLDNKILSWQLLFKYSSGIATFQPWVEIDYWLISEMTDESVAPEIKIDSKPMTISVSALHKLLKSTPHNMLDLDLIEAYRLWPLSRELAFQFLGDEAEATIGSFVMHLKRIKTNLDVDFDPELEPGEFPTWFVWSPKAINELLYREERLIEMILDNKRIPENQFYSSYRSTNAWIEVADVATNSGQAASVAQLESISEDIANCIPDGVPLDLLSLGPGEGIKDAKLIDSLSKLRNQDIHYYPVDISPLMIGIAVKHIKREIEKIKVTGVIADFTSKTSRIRDLILQTRSDSLKLISFLGNTLGNVKDDWGLVQKLGSVLNTDDFLLLEIRRIESFKYSTEGILAQSPTQKKFHLEPLASIGASYKDEDVSYESEIGPRSKSIKVYCDNVSHERFSPRKVDLFEIKHYEKSFFDEIAKEINAEIILRSESENQMSEIGLFKKKSDRLS